jgi:hypothetical protein
LTPIPGENPSGIDLRYDTKLLVHDKIKEARRQDDNLAQGAWQSERKTANFALVVKLAQDAAKSDLACAQGGGNLRGIDYTVTQSPPGVGERPVHSSSPRWRIPDHPRMST